MPGGDPPAVGRAEPRVPPVRRVLMTADAVGGVWPYSLDLASALHSRGVEVTIAVSETSGGQILIQWIFHGWGSDLDRPQGSAGSGSVLPHG